MAASFFLLGVSLALALQHLLCNLRLSWTLGGNITDAMTICLRDLHDFQLALVLCRIIPSLGTVCAGSCVGSLYTLLQTATPP